MSRYDYKNDILTRLPITTLLQHYDLTPKHGFIRCPFHKDDTASCRIYPRTNTFYCFGCGAGGNVIDFAMRWYDLPFFAAIEKLNNEFALGLPIGRKRTLREQITADLAAKNAERERKEREAAKAAAIDKYFHTLDRWIALQRQKEVYAPTSPAEQLHPLFVKALFQIDAAEDDFAEAEGEVIALATG